jgi:HD-like signal output (HDOD) protein
MAQFQQRSLATARLCKLLLGASARSDEAFTAGMVHDIGLILIASNLPERFSEIAAEVQGSRRPVYQIEKAILGITHAEVGGYLLGVWGLQMPIIEAVAFHHEPSQSIGEDRELLAVVHVADVLVDSDRPGDAVTTDERPLDMEFLERAGVAKELPRWRAIAAQFRKQQAK